jgi:hypothetical protein
MKPSKQADLLGKASRAGADQALESLVHQFTDPLSFLRELIQNSMDAGATDVEVTFERQPDGLVAIELLDNGEGMNESIIDDYLLTLFRSTKEGDLTKIGKFGIGFVSIFAIEPEMAVVETGRGGEYWRIVFSAKGRFDKIRLHDPVEGTSVRLFKRMDAEAFEDLRSRAAETIAYWCKFAETRIRVDGRPIQRKFGVEAALPVSFTAPGTEVWFGFTPPGSDSLVGFYNRGLTLVETDQVPGFAKLEGLSLVVKSRYLEHTLTRDNVLQDEAYHKVLSEVARLVNERLRPRLIDHLRKLALYHSGEPIDAPDPGPPGLDACFGFATLRCMDLLKRVKHEPIIPCLHGPPLSLAQLSKVGVHKDELLYSGQANRVTGLLAERGWPVIVFSRRLITFVERVLDVRCLPANGSFVSPAPVKSDAGAVDLLSRLAALLEPTGLRIERLVWGDLAYAGSAIAHLLALRQEEAFGLTRPGRDDRVGLLGGARQLVVNWNHPLAERCRKLFARDPLLAVGLIAQGIAAQEEPDPRRAARLAAQSLGQRWPADGARSPGSAS